MEKITKRQALNHILTLVDTDEIAINYITHELELLDKKNNSNDEKTQATNDLQEIVLNLFEPNTQYKASELANQLEISTPRITSVLTKLVASKQVERIADKKQSYYKLA